MQTLFSQTLADSTADTTSRLTSLLGLFAMIGFAWLLSTDRRRVSLRMVLGGLLLQFAFALLVLRTEPGQQFFDMVRIVFTNILDSVDSASLFLFGKNYAEHFFAFKVLPTIIFFSAFSAVLYYYGIIQFVVRGLGWVMQKTLGTSGAESLSAAGNIFVGQTEAPLLVRPYLNSMTRSELMAVMVGGFATVAGGVMAAFVGMGIDAGHLLTASVISAPAALMIAKVMQPETEQPATLGIANVPLQTEHVNVFDAMTYGASEGAKLAINIAAMIIAFLAAIALADLALGELGALFGQEWSLALAMGYVFAPFAWLMGVDSNDVFVIGELLGYKTVFNEFIAYEKLAAMTDISARSRIIATYALCGFANFGSVGVQIGGLSILAPDRKADLARIGLKAMIGGTLAAFMTACVAGMLI